MKANITLLCIILALIVCKNLLEVRLEDETVWLTQKLMAELFQIVIKIHKGQ